MPQKKKCSALRLWSKGYHLGGLLPEDVKYIHFLSAGVKTKQEMKWPGTNELNRGSKTVLINTNHYPFYRKNKIVYVLDQSL